MMDRKMMDRKIIVKASIKNANQKNVVTLATSKSRNSSKICASIRSHDEPQSRCLMKTKNNEKYCPMHIIQKNIIDYNYIDDDFFELDQKNLELNKIITNDLSTKISVNELQKENSIISPVISSRSSPKSATNRTMYEQKVSTIKKTLENNEDDLEIKLLILVNDEYSDVISELIGPVFHDVTLSEDEQDPITFDEIWTLKNGLKVPANINKYYLFSYEDSQNKIRCLSVFTMYNMLNEKNYHHPITSEEIPPKDIKRAKKLINLYQSKLSLFKIDNSNLSPEFKLKNRLTKLFKQFHIHSIYFEEKWLLQLSDKTKLYKIIKETEKLVSNNIKSINPKLSNFKIFQKKEPVRSYSSKTKPMINTDNIDDEIFELREYIVDEWEKLIQAADTPQNQIPAWILASGLSFVVPEVKQKYPDLEIML